MTRGTPRLFVCYVPGLDLRRLSVERLPTVARLARDAPRARIRTLPDTELSATMLTGTWPHEHGVWQLRLREDPDLEPSGWLDRLPDLLATTATGLLHALTGEHDLATMPPRRRRLFELRRFKYERRMESWEEPSARRPSIFALLGPRQSRYWFTAEFDRVAEFRDALPSVGPGLTLLELYAFDLAQHWNLDRPGTMMRLERRVDEAVRELLETCTAAGIEFLLLSDHGQEPVVRTIDLRARLAELGMDDEFVHYLQVPSARFWFRTERAERAVKELLSELPDVTVMDWSELGSLGIRFEDGSFGELYAFAGPGVAFFPHDFYQPLANLYLGLRDPKQRPRIWNPVHRGCHGYLPEHPSETGFLTYVGERELTFRPELELVDLAPTLLSLLDAPIPDHLSGRSAWEG